MVTEGSQITNKMENVLIILVHHEMDIIIHKQIMIVQLNAEVEDRRVRDSSRMENWSQNKLVSISTHKTANIGNKMTEDAKRNCKYWHRDPHSINVESMEDDNCVRQIYVMLSSLLHNAVHHSSTVRK